MQTRAVHCGTWAGFKRILDLYAARPIERRLQFWFRGHADATWPLHTTLDRRRSFASDTERDAVIARLIDEFRHEMLRLGADPAGVPTGDALELLARHHGFHRRSSTGPNRRTSRRSSPSTGPCRPAWWCGRWIGRA